uniref:Uncharacterized protein LOC114338960 n=1 Tax=Diabrotica virgifera virgifera TaxID=50390 RepID=A0A6P7G8B5_DIAVI
MSTKFLIILILGVFKASAIQEEYLQWVDVTDDFPATAVQGGLNSEGQTTYIGRVYHTTADAEGYVPGTITNTSNSIDVILFNQCFTVTNKIQVLTTVGDDTKVDWISSTSEDFTSLFDSDLYFPVRGGWEQALGFNSTTYIGKTKFNTLQEVGKIFNSANIDIARNHILYFPIEDRVTYTSTYSVLVYYFKSE